MNISKMHRIGNFKTISAYSEVTLLQLVQHTDELSFVSLPVLKCCGNLGDRS